MLRPIALAASAVLALAACGDGAEDGRTRGGDVAVGPDGTGAQAGDEMALLSGPIPPDACAYLAENRAADILGGPPTLRPGPGCAYAAGASAQDAALHMLLTSYPLEHVDMTRQSRSEIAAALGELMFLETPLADAGEIAGGPAFSLEEEGASRLIVVPGVRTTAAVSDRPVGEVVVALRLHDDRSHAERLEVLRYAAEDAVARLEVGGD